MRELKFRAWSKRDNCWYGAFALHMSGLLTECFPPKGEVEWVELSKDSDILVVQYTGMDDRKNNTIYEGDIVEYLSRNTKFVVSFEKGEWRIKGDGMWKYLHGLQVVGNIYENPDLIDNL